MRNNFYLRYIFYRFILFKRKNKIKTIKKISWVQRVKIFENKLNKTMVILSHARSPYVIVKSFDYITELIQELKLHKPWWVSKQVFIFSYDIMNYDNIKLVKNAYMKVFLIQRI